MRLRPLLLTLPLAAACSSGDPEPPSATGPSFGREVAPILHAHCAGCHYPGNAAPFALLTWEDAAPRSGQIAEVTASRYMPPWLPAPGAHAFEGERRLTEAQIATLAAWDAAGAPAGDPAEHPAPPPYPTAGWRLGEPDLVLTAAEAYPLAAEGRDEFRNLILPVPGERTRYVRAAELRVDVQNVVHHAILQVDSAGGCRMLDQVDAEAGFAGMSMGTSRPPDGHFIAWTPGKVPRELPPDMSWRLEPGTDLVLQVHLTKSGKPETIQPSIGLYFGDAPPTRFPFSIVLYSETIDIPAGESRYVVGGQLELAADVELVALYPHAHFLGRSVRATIVRTGASEEEELLRIDDWDFDWQDEYVFAEPLVLPRGTLLRMEWVYDNSEANPRNPNAPPRRVRFGQRSVDEMGTLTWIVLPRLAEDLGTLEIARWRQVLEKNPRDWDAYTRLGLELIREDRLDEAIEPLERALTLNPDYADALDALGSVYLQRQRLDLAGPLFRRALEADRNHRSASVNFGRALTQAARDAEAQEHYESLLLRMPDLVEARVDYANLLALSGNPVGAIAQYEEALRARPGLPEALNNLANTYLAIDAPEQAIPYFERAIEQRPEYFNARFNLGRALLDAGRPADAVPHLRVAVKLRPKNAAVREALQRALATSPR